MIETVGVGQAETDVAEVADTVAVVVQPGSGDVLQFLKAGIMEIPDVLVVTKADLGQMALRAPARPHRRAALARLPRHRGLAVSSLPPVERHRGARGGARAAPRGLDLARAAPRARAPGALTEFARRARRAGADADAAPRGTAAAQDPAWGARARGGAEQGMANEA